VAARCHVAPEERSKLIELLEDLAEKGDLKRLAGKRFRAADTKKKGAPPRGSTPLFEGTIIVHPRGFGFVSGAGQGQDDIFIPADAIGPALHGDTVLAEVTGRTPKGREGRVVDVVKRRSARVAGVLRKRRKSIWVEPDDARVRGPILVTEGAENAKDGSAVVVEITRFPTRGDESPEARLFAELGEPGNHEVEVKKILLREGVDEEHPPLALLEAEQLAARRMPIADHGRKDLRHLPFLTIDPDDARDHDDAIWVERREAGGYRLYVAIADVSEYVAPGTELDAEALNRSFTIYLPDRAVPMLPTALAADLCSLLPERDRLCLCAIMILDANGRVTRTTVVEGVIRGAAYLTYGSVAQTLGFTDQFTAQPAALAFKKDLKVLDEVTRKLRRLRMGRGALDLDLPEPKLTLEEETLAPSWVEKRTQDPGVKRAYQLVEECMLAANEAVARWLQKRHSAGVYRVHAKPDEEKLERLANICEVLSVPCDIEALLEPKGLGRFLRKVANHEKAQVLEGLLLRSLKQAAYDVHNIGHFGLAAEAYVHFT
jgi:ribonuclease R